MSFLEELASEGKFNLNGSNDQYINRAKQLVIDEVNCNLHPTDPEFLRPENVYVVWFSKVLQNWKAMVSTDKPSSSYFELTHNGDKGETYVDHYARVNNRAVPNV